MLTIPDSNTMRFSNGSENGEPKVDPKYHYWVSQSYDRETVKRRPHDKKFKYYDSCSFVKFLFFHWVKDWAQYISKSYVEPYKFHPLPDSDQILKWQPIFSKHVSDGLLMQQSKTTNKKRCSVFLRALFLTFWKRCLVTFFGIIATNVLSMNIAILVKYLLKTLNTKSFGIFYIFAILLAIIMLQVVDVLLIENIRFFVHRVSYVMQYSIAVTTFQHGLCSRRKYSNVVEGANPLNVCNKVLHSCSPDSSCSSNELFCTAMCYQSKNVNPQIYLIDFTDSYYVPLFIESLSYILEFLANFVYGIILMSLQIKGRFWILYVIAFLFTFIMVVIEVLNAYILFYIFKMRDFRNSKTNQIIPRLPLIRKILFQSIAINTITQTRTDELILYFLRQVLSFLSNVLYSISCNVSFFILKYYFVKSILNADVITDIDTASFLTTFYIFLKIVDSMFLIPLSFKILNTFFVSYIRVKKYLQNCSPNFYISDNKFTGPIKMSSEISTITSDIDRDVIVLFKNASFTWVNNRDDLLNKNYEIYLKDVNFELKKGEVAIITGGQGSGKSNFIKSVLGEMTLVGGSMAVVPLHTSMPIFYASQDVWLQHGTIRSNITFGYRFDEELYDTVVKAVELEFDISTWENGDLRVLHDNAHSLSGGQRVRMAMARAIYAYLIFSKVNREYNDGRCCFVMCLDSTFYGLDPFVSRTVFHNLFNLNSGILTKSDLSVVLSATRVVLDKCLALTDLSDFPNMPIYSVENGIFSFYSYLSDFARGKKSEVEFMYFSNRPIRSNCMSYFSKDLFSLCNSFASTRMGRTAITKFKYSTSFTSVIKENYAGHKFNPYTTFIRAAGVTLIIFIIITLAVTLMDDAKFVISTNMCDYINRQINQYNEGVEVDLDGVKSRINLTLTIILVLVVLIIVLSFLSIGFLSYSSFIASRRIHEYCLNSFFNISSSVLKVKNNISTVLTFLTCDMFMIDENIGYMLSNSILSFIQMLIHIIILFYMIPLSIPFVLISLFSITKYIFLPYVNCSRNVHISYLESISHLNSVFENAITGSHIYRSFKKEFDLIKNHVEHTDYKMRCKFMMYSTIMWSSISFNWIFSLSTFSILIFMIIFDKFTKYKMKVGYFALGLSLNMKVIKSFTKFSICFLRLSIYMCSMQRFQLFVPPGRKCEFRKPYNIHYENYVYNSEVDDTNTEGIRQHLMKRRKAEFRRDNRRFYSIRKIFFKPKINFVDVSKHLTPQHSGVELRDVSAYTSYEMTKEGTILKNINASANKGDIIGIIGRTGAGKTTLLSVLQNITHHRTGSVLLDGKDLKDIEKPILRNIIGVLPQHPFVLKGWTVRRFLDPRRLFTDDEINNALEMCGLLDLVNNLPGGKRLDSVIIKENLVNFIPTDKLSPSVTLPDESNKVDMVLSNTQLRTLWFAMLVLYRHFYRVIVFDEPPSDNCGDEKIYQVHDVGLPVYELLEKYFTHCTTFVTAHDSNVLKNCTSVWVMHNGKLIRTCKSSEVGAIESISKILQEIVKRC